MSMCIATIDPAEDTDAMPQILGSSVSYRIAVGPQQGRKAFMIHTIRSLGRPDPGLDHKSSFRSCGFHCQVGGPGTTNQGPTCHAASFRREGRKWISSQYPLYIAYTSPMEYGCL
jgi:hypothetical protein